jgi:hypothetical protein
VCVGCVIRNPIRHTKPTLGSLGPGREVKPPDRGEDQVIARRLT